MDEGRLKTELRTAGLFDGNELTLEPLKGGVSSDVLLASDGTSSYVVKRALPKLRVEDDWFADPGRSRVEREFAEFMQAAVPGSVPGIVYRGDDFFVMEYLDDSYRNWKVQMMEGTFEETTAERAADMLAGLHSLSRHRDQLRERFDAGDNFRSLRIEPYLEMTAKRHPELAEPLLAEARRLEGHREAVIHGDFSPKNIMVHPDRIVLLDHEVAWYGDPAFDLAFLLTHLHLKMIPALHNGHGLCNLAGVAWNRYRQEAGSELRRSISPRVPRLLLYLMLARIDGKSPVEYLDEQDQERVRRFVYRMLAAEPPAVPKITEHWITELTD